MGFALERLAEAGRELRRISTRLELIEAVPRLLCSISGIDGCAMELESQIQADRPTVARVGVGDERWGLVLGPGNNGEVCDPRALELFASLVEACFVRVSAGEPRPPTPITAKETHDGPGSSGRIGRGSARFTFDDLLGADPTFLACLEVARRAANSDMPLLITGETGTKEMLAQASHNASARRARGFVGINVAAIPRELLESELFGYDRGAFTGARSNDKPGLFELAGDGTLLLDEIGDMPIDLQVKLLRVLQERVVQPVGGARQIPLRARIISTTHHDLREATRIGTFRSDLYYRLRGVHLRVPALRERSSDIPLLIGECLARFAARHGRPTPHVAPRVIAAYMEHDWPGNVRELMQMIEAEASVLPEGEHVLRRMPTLQRYRSRRAAREPDRAPSTSPPPVSSIDDVERRAYEEALRRFAGNVTEASRALGVSRGTLYNKARRYGLELRESVRPPAPTKKS